MILAEVPGAIVDGRVGRRSSFEVTINNKQVFSKLAQGGFPEFEKVRCSLIFNYYDGKN